MGLRPQIAVPALKSLALRNQTQNRSRSQVHSLLFHLLTVVSPRAQNRPLLGPGVGLTILVGCPDLGNRRPLNLVAL